ncbi:MAG: hypothetical protein LBD55_09000 [Treponema sp.]|nr:hypothetical protein [Treponema sp.]
MKKTGRFFLMGVSGLALTFGLVLGGCPTDTGRSSRIIEPGTGIGSETDGDTSLGGGGY